MLNEEPRLIRADRSSLWTAHVPPTSQPPSLRGGRLWRIPPALKKSAEGIALEANLAAAVSAVFFLSGQFQVALERERHRGRPKQRQHAGAG